MMIRPAFCLLFLIPLVSTVDLFPSRASSSPPSPSHSNLTLFKPWDQGIPCWRVPSVISVGPTLIIFAEGRWVTGDGCDPSGAPAHNPFPLVDGPPWIRAIFMRVSRDNGKTWGEIKHVVGGNDLYGDVMEGPTSNPTSVYDENAQALILMFDRDYGFPSKHWVHPAETWFMKSYDGGETWQSPQRIDATFGPEGPKPSPARAGIFPGPGRGIQLKHGPNSGRLLFAGYHNLDALYDVAFYSDDGGNSWNVSQIQAREVGGNATQTFSEMSEPQVVEFSNGIILLTMRNTNAGKRGAAISLDGGSTFTESLVPPGANLYGPAASGVMSPIIAMRDGTLVYAVPYNATSAPDGRANMTVFKSTDYANTWQIVSNVYHGPTTYSGLVELPASNRSSSAVAIAYEADHPKLCPGQESCAIYWMALSV